MPAESYPVLALVLTMFGAFMITLGGVSLWCGLGERKGR